MTNLYVNLILITATTVGKIILCSVGGMFISRFFFDPEKSRKGLSYIAMKVFLPCLLFSNLCLNVTWEQLRKFYWAPVFAFLPMTLGFLSSLLVRHFLTKEYRYVLILASTFQNGLTFPVSILLNLKGVSWFSGVAVVDGQSYIFLYNVICSIGLWAIGDPMIAYAKAKEMKEEAAAQDGLDGADDRRQKYFAMGPDGAEVAYANRSFSFPYEAPLQEGRREHREEALTTPLSPRSAAAEAHRCATAREQLLWYRPAHAKDHPIAAPPGSPIIVLEGEMGCEDVRAVDEGKGSQLHRIGRIAFKSIKSPPVLSSLLAIIISLTPPLRWVAESSFSEPFLGGLALTGQGAIPLQLLVLGASIAASRPTSDTTAAKAAPHPVGSAASPGDADGTIVDVTATQPQKDTNAVVRFITSKASPQFIFTWFTVLTRLIVIPTICFIVLHLLLKMGVLPNEKPFLLSMLVAMMSPSAMNSTMICALHVYHASDYARMIFFMYLTTIFTSTVWLFIIILYLGE